MVKLYLWIRFQVKLKTVSICISQLRRDKPQTSVLFFVTVPTAMINMSFKRMEGKDSTDEGNDESSDKQRKEKHQ